MLKTTAKIRKHSSKHISSMTCWYVHRSIRQAQISPGRSDSPSRKKLTCFQPLSFQLQTCNRTAQGMLPLITASAIEADKENKDNIEEPKTLAEHKTRINYTISLLRSLKKEDFAEPVRSLPFTLPPRPQFNLSILHSYILSVHRNPPPRPTFLPGRFPGSIQRLRKIYSFIIFAEIHLTDVFLSYGYCL